jgi:hypothetical protein
MMQINTTTPPTNLPTNSQTNSQTNPPTNSPTNPPTNSPTNPPTNKFKGFFGNKTVKINLLVTDLISIFIAFYGILYVSQVSSIFTCQQNMINKDNKLYQYIFTFGIFYFVATLVNKTELDFPPIQKLINCFIYFILFLIVNRLDYRVMITILASFCFIYFINLNKEYYFTVNPTTNTVELNNNLANSSKAVSLINSSSENIEKTAATIENHQYWITMDYPFTIRLFAVSVNEYYYLSILNKIIIVLIIILTIIGFIQYYGLLKYTFDNKVTFYNIIFENPNCKPLNYKLTFFDYILLAFDYNYYINKLGKKT